MNKKEKRDVLKTLMRRQFKWKMESSINKSGKINYEFCECVEKYEDGLARFGLAPYQTFKIPK